MEKVFQVFEFFLACKYLSPRWRKLSVSIISWISIGVIALVVWLIVVFLSVTHGLEKAWVDKLLGLTAPIRVTPTEKYFNSYYYNIDAFSEESNYRLKSLDEKLQAERSDPYNPLEDASLPETFPLPELNGKKELLDPVKVLYKGLKEFPEITPSPFEVSAGNIQVDLVRNGSHSVITQSVYFSPFDQDNERLFNSLSPYTSAEQEKIAFFKKNPLSQGVFFPKNFKEAGVLVGDSGFISFQGTSTSGVKEERVPIFVEGFYDPGVIPIGGRFVLVPKDLSRMIFDVMPESAVKGASGLNLHFSSLDHADLFQRKLQDFLDEEGVSPYFSIKTFKEFEFTKEILQQIHSEKNLFMILSGVILLVASSNIVSMLIILVNDKKSEIGILRAMGATPLQISTLFGFVGSILGLLGSSLGLIAAIFTLKHLDVLVNLLTKLQGYTAFNPNFYGENLPSDLSLEAICFVLVATTFFSLVAGIVPAVKASLMQPSHILRAE